MKPKNRPNPIVEATAGFSRDTRNDDVSRTGLFALPAEFRNATPKSLYERTLKITSKIVVVATERKRALVKDDFTFLVSPERYDPKLKPVKARNPQGIEASRVFFQLNPFARPAL